MAELEIVEEEINEIPKVIPKKEVISFIDNSNDLKIEFKKKKEIYTELDDNPDRFTGKIKFFDFNIKK